MRVTDISGCRKGQMCLRLGRTLVKILGHCLFSTSKEENVFKSNEYIPYPENHGIQKDMQTQQVTNCSYPEEVFTLVQLQQKKEHLLLYDQQ